MKTKGFLFVFPQMLHAVNHHKPVGDTPGSTGAGNWATADRRPAHVMVQPAADPRWTNVTSVAPRTVVNTPMLQVQVILCSFDINKIKITLIL